MTDVRSSTSPSWPLRLHAGTAAVVAGLVALAVFAAAAGNPPAAAEPVAQTPATGGTWYCPVTAQRNEAAILSVAAAGDAPSTVTLLRSAAAAGESRLQVDRTVVVQPGEAYEARLAPNVAQQPSVVLWRDAPAVASWRADSQAAAGATCIERPSKMWYFAGLDTSGGASSVLHLFNPFDDDAVADVRFATPAGPVVLVSTEGLVVPAGEVVRLDLGEVRPEEPDLAAMVEVTAGRLVAQAEVRIPGRAAGRSLVSAAPRPQRASAFALTRGERSWLSLLNPGERPAAVEIRVSDAAGGTTAPLGEVSVPAGGVTRADLEGVSAPGGYGIVVESVNDVAIVASQRQQPALSRDRVATAVVAGQVPAAEWLLPAAGGDRRSVVAVYNPGAEPVRVTLSSGGDAFHDTRLLAANAVEVVDLAELGDAVPAAPVIVRAQAPVAAARWTFAAGGRPRFSAATGAPAASWTGPSTRPAVRRDPALAVSPEAAPG